VAQILVVEMNLGALCAAFARGVFDFAFAVNLNRFNLHQTKLPFLVERETIYIEIAYGSQGFHKHVARPNRAQQRNPTITAERDKV